VPRGATKRYNSRQAEFLRVRAPYLESPAACRDCVLIAGREEAGGAGRTFFDSTTHCCTYLPELPNFIVGPILADADPRMAPGRRSHASLRDEGMSIVLVTHNIYHAFTVSDHFGLLSRGKKVLDADKHGTDLEELTRIIVTH